MDGAQLVAHKAIDMRGKNNDEAIDFLVFSGHKMYAPLGSGAIVGNFVGIPKLVPLIWGGGMVEKVEDYNLKLDMLPNVFEGGTQNLLGVLGIEASMRVLQSVGFDTIVDHERKLKKHLFQELTKMDKVILYGDTEDISDRLGVISFNIVGRTYMEVATLLADRFAVATRCGKFCAYPYVNRLLELKNSPETEVPGYYGEYGMIRISLGLYNTREEMDEFLNILEYLCRYM